MFSSIVLLSIVAGPFRALTVSRPSLSHAVAVQGVDLSFALDRRTTPRRAQLWGLLLDITSGRPLGRSYNLLHLFGGLRPLPAYRTARTIWNGAPKRNKVVH